MNEEEVRRMLRDHHARVEPDAGFADRVVARLRYEPSEMLGWAAVRLLPAALALIVALGWMASRDQPTAPVVETVESTDVLDWLFEDEGAGSS